MAKPWSRYQVGFINHPKFRALSANAILLWVEAKNYTDEHLTDGYLPLAIVKGFRFFSKKAMHELMQSIGQKDATGQEHYAALWESHAMGIKLHDYLEHNEPADAHRARMQSAEQAKGAHRERMKAWRGKRVTQRVTPPVTGVVTSQTPVVTLLTEEKEVTPPNPPTGGQSEGPLIAAAKRALAESETLLADTAVASKAAAFLERYPATYAKARNGARYAVREARDFTTACDLVTQWPDEQHLDDMLRLFLLKKDFAPKNEPGSPRQFAFMAPQCDALLRAARRA